MALIKCPECGREISDKAVSCPTCGFPIASVDPQETVGPAPGTVIIRMDRPRTAGISGRQSVVVYSAGKILWEGRVGDTAELVFDGPTEITVMYRLNGTLYGNGCTGKIDPDKNQTYEVAAAQGFLSNKLVLRAVDGSDAG